MSVQAGEAMRSPSNFLASVAAFFALTGAGMLHYKITLSDSLPRGIYQQTREPVAHGVIVAECLPLEWAQLGKERGWLGRGKCPGRVEPILKQIAGLPGDEVEIAEEYVAINGAFVPNTARRKTDSKGRKIPAVELGKVILQEDEIFCLATNSEMSWDGRYMGRSKIQDVIATFQPVWTEKAK